MRLQFGLDAFEHRAKSVAAQRIVNCYLEKTTANAANPITLVGSYGIGAFATVGEGPIRGGKVINGVPFIVSGTKLYSLEQSGEPTELGTVHGGGPVTIAGDGNKVAVAADGLLYAWDGTTVSRVGDADLPGAESIDFISIYYIATHAGQIYISDDLDPTSWNALNFLSAEASPDDIVGTIVEKGELFCGGRDTIQSFFVSDEQVPLSRVPEGVAEIGLLSKFGFGKIDNSVFFPAVDFTVRRFVEGYLPAVISTPFISQVIEDLSDREKSELRGFTWGESGHSFYALTCSRWTYAYDASTQLWHQRKSYGFENWRPIAVLTAFNRILVCDGTSNLVGEMSPTVFTEFGQPVEMIGTCSVSVASADYQPMFAPSIELVFERGPGTPVGQGEDPQVMMRQSFNGGHTWTSERWRPMGKTGEYEARALWTRCGMARNGSRVIEFAISDPVRRALAYASMKDPELGEY